MAVSNLFARYDHEGDVLHLWLGAREHRASYRLDEGVFIEQGLCTGAVVGLVISGYEKFFRSHPQLSRLLDRGLLPEPFIRFLRERPRFRAIAPQEPLDSCQTSNRAPRALAAVSGTAL